MENGHLSVEFVHALFDAVADPTVRHKQQSQMLTHQSQLMPLASTDSHAAAELLQTVLGRCGSWQYDAGTVALYNNAEL